MDIYEHSPYEVKAAQFTGGAESARDIIDGLAAKGMEAKWIGATPSIGFDEDDLKQLDDERITCTEIIQAIRVGSWVVIEPNGAVLVFANSDDFRAKFVKPSTDA